MKNIIKTIAIVSAISAIFSYTNVHANQNQIKININGESFYTEVPAQIIEGSTMVPMRGIFEALSIHHVFIQWDGETQTITAQWGIEYMSLTIGNNLVQLSIIDRNTGQLSETSIESPIPPKIINGLAFVPLRIVSEALGAEVSWDATTQIVNITQNITRLPATPENITMIEQELFQLINEHRVNNGLQPFIWSDVAHQASRMHSKNIRQDIPNRLGDGSSSLERIQRVNPNHISQYIRQDIAVVLSFSTGIAQHIFNFLLEFPIVGGKVYDDNVNSHAGVGIIVDEIGMTFVTIKSVSE